jgi:hypothetical protein
MKVLALLLAVAPTLLADPAAQLAELDFLEGHWRGETWHGYTTSPEGGVILTLAKEYDASGAATFFEFERIAVEGEQVVLTPSPFGKPSVSFPMVELDVVAKRVRFENPAHDFPRSIQYHRSGPEELVFTLHGERGGEPVESVTRLRRVAASSRN